MTGNDPNADEGQQGASKTPYPCGSCNQECKSKCIECRDCKRWFHQACTPITGPIMNQLGKIRGLFWICDSCISDDPLERLSNSVSRELSEIKTTIQDALVDIKSSIVANTQASTNIEAKSFADIVKADFAPLIKQSINQMKNKSDFSKELRFSGIPEYNSVSDIRPNRSEIFEHDEKSIKDTLENLGFEDPSSIFSSAQRLGKFSSTNIRPRTILVKFNNEYIAEKILSRALKLKDYVGHYG